MKAGIPIGHGDKNLIHEPLFTELGKKYGKTNVQIILRIFRREILFSRNPRTLSISAITLTFRFLS